MQKGLISVIVPVYNAEKYLHRCIDSILSQSYQNIELLLINDGSTDGSERICKAYAEKDNRVVYIDKENGGVSSARNLGIEKAAGEYITFIDSDDKIEPDSLSVLFNSAISNNADFVLPRTKYVIHDADGNFMKDDFDDDDFNIVLSPQNFSADFLKIFNRAFTSTCGRLYSNDVLKSNNLLFDKNIKVLEDVVFNLNYLQKCKTISKIAFVVYDFEVYDIGAYSRKRNYEYIAFGAKSYYYAITEFLDTKAIPNDKKYFDLASDYWQMAIRNMLEAKGVSAKTVKTLKEYAKEILSEDLYNKCTVDNIDTDFKLLFNKGNVYQFLAVHYLKKLKAKLRNITQR